MFDNTPLYETSKAEFTPFPKMARLSREITITEKIDGTNAQIHITDNGDFYVGSRTRWIVPGDDNFGFAKWAYENKDELMKLGVGSHFGEWWGQGIQRSYGMQERVFSLFNTERWSDDAVIPRCCTVVPILYSGVFDQQEIETTLHTLKHEGSKVSPGFMNPEGIAIYHKAAKHYFKKTIFKDESPKGMNQ